MVKRRAKRKRFGIRHADSGGEERRQQCAPTLPSKPLLCGVKAMHSAMLTGTLNGIGPKKHRHIVSSNTYFYRCWFILTGRRVALAKHMVLYGLTSSGERRRAKPSRFFTGVTCCRSWWLVAGGKYTIVAYRDGLIATTFIASKHARRRGAHRHIRL